MRLPFLPNLIQITVLLFLLILTIINAIEEKRCLFSVELTISPQKDAIIPFALHNSSIRGDAITDCTILDGNFNALVRGTRKTTNMTNVKFPVFQNLREITGRVLILWSHGLEDLGKMLPNLQVIRGESDIGGFSLIIMFNDKLKVLGLNKLKVIQNGGIRIAENPELCYSRFINWNAIVMDNSSKILVDKRMENQKRHCQDSLGCEVEDPGRCLKVGGILSCWNSTTCQEHCKYHKLSNGIVGPGCNLKGEKCHSSCLGGCDVPSDPGSCYSCQNYEFNGKCVDRCPPGFFIHMSRRCVTESECHAIPYVHSYIRDGKFSWKAFQGKCHFECPDGYRDDFENPHKCIAGEIDRKCKGSEFIYSVDDALRYSRCQIIEGNLKINIEKGDMDQLRMAFQNIREITGSDFSYFYVYLSIYSSPAITTLNIFSNLQIIRGKTLINDQYALSVLKMPNLKTLFPQNISIENGTIAIQNNPKLCHDKISKFALDSMSKIDISSNGENAICNAIRFPIEIDGYEHFHVYVKWNNLSDYGIDEDLLTGFILYYKKVDKIDPNMDIDDGTDWTAVFVNDQKAPYVYSLMVNHVMPNTIYACYVETQSIKNSGTKNAISNLEFYATTFIAPDRPRLKRAEAGGPDTIVLEWDPPIEANGVITHYTVSWSAKSRDAMDGFDPCGSEATISSLLPQKIFNNEKLAPAEWDFENAVESEEDFGHFREFEDKILNTVFTPYNKVEGIRDAEYLDHRNDLNAAQFRATKDENDAIESFPKVSNENITHGRINISSSRLVITDLFHFTEYYIQIVACQDVTAEKNYCSEISADYFVRTDPIPEKDLVNPKSFEKRLTLVNAKVGKGKLVKWKLPENPNGEILGFRYKFWRDGDQNPNEQCVTKSEFDKFSGIILPQNLSSGVFNFEVRTISSAGISEKVFVKDLFFSGSGSQEGSSRIFSFLLAFGIVGAGFFLAFWFCCRNSFNVKIRDILVQPLL